MRPTHRLLVLLSLTWACPAAAQDAKLQPPVLVTAPPAPYPEQARQAKQQGTVELELTISADGKVTDVRVVGSVSDELDAAASDAARRFAFTPAKRGDRAIASKIRYAYRFELKADTPTAKADSAPEVVPSEAAKGKTDPIPAAEEEVGVRGQRPERETSKRELTREELRTMPGTGGDPLRAVQSMPGVARAPAFTDLLIVRGSSPAGTGLFFDGAYMPRAFHFGGLSAVMPAEMLEKIDYYPGNFSARYGRHDGGIVDLKSRPAAGDRLHALAQVDLIDGRVFVETPLPGGLRLVAGARRSWLDAWLGPVLRDADVGVKTVPYYYDGQIFVETNPTPTSTLRAGFYTSLDVYKLVARRPLGDEPALSGGFSTRSGFWRAQVNFDTELSSRLKFSTMVSVGPDHQTERLGTLLADSTISFMSARGELSYEATRWLTVRGGWDVLAGTYDATLRIPNLPVIGGAEVPPITSQRPFTWHGQGTLSRPAAFVEARLSPVERWQIVPSVRADYTNEFKEWVVAPRLSSRLGLTDGAFRTAVRGGLGVYYQPPEYNAVIPIFGTKSLTSSRAVHSSLAIEQALGEGAEASVEGFHKRIDDIPSHDPANGPVATNANGASGRVIGLETQLKLRPRGRLSGWVAYTLSRTTRKDSPDSATRLYEFDQPHVFTALASVRAGRGFTVGGRFRYTSGVPYTPCIGGSLAADAGVYSCVNGAPQTARVPAFHQLDLRVEKSWELPSWKLTAYLDVQNVYNRANPDGVTYSYDKSKVTFQTGLPILPIVGVRGEL